MNNPSFDGDELESAFKSIQTESLIEIGSKQDGRLDSSFSATISMTDCSDSTSSRTPKGAALSGSNNSTATNDLADTMADALDINDNPAAASAPDQESSRLVEYFVMVSSVPVEEHNKKKERKARSRPPNPKRDKMNRSTAARFEVRKAHLPSTENTDEDDDEEDNKHLTALEPKITARYPSKDHKDQPLNLRLPQFCHPQGTDIIYPTSQYKMPRIHHFVLTDNMGCKQYGTCLTVYEEFESEDKNNNNNATNEKKKTYYAPRVLCLLSTYPYLTAFRTYLTQLYRLATMTDCMTAPIERYVQNICCEVPAPPPGAFEVQLEILNTPIRFWAPPANQPIAYVSLPFQVLFECLDISNVLFAWYSLACERKVLLVSQQVSLLTVCSEILCSLLFPMKWSHLYIPVLPRSLCPMLDAPMPYLCGISRANFPYAVQEISDETIVVDLDRNVITMGPNCPELPPLPHKRRQKLEATLKANVGNVFWEARNLDKDDMLKVKNTGSNTAMKIMLEKAGTVWEDKVKARDDAFNLACAPDAAALEFDDDALAGSDSGVLPKQSRWDSVQEAFLRFYVSSLQDYKKFIPTKSTDTRSSWRGKDGRCELRYNSEEFVHAAPSDFQPFLSELVMTQQFDDFISRRMYNASDDPGMKFFDQSVDAKKNRSMLKFKKVDTHFLHSAKARRDLKNVKAVYPSREDLPDEKKAYSPYKIWPLKFDESLFGKARPVPSAISAEFDRRHSLHKMLRSQHGVVDDTRTSGGHNRSPEVTSFVLFFATFTGIIGRELSAVKKNEYRFEIGSEVYHPLLNQFAKKSMNHDSNQNSRRQRKNDFDDDMEVARVIAKTQVDVAYNVLSLMHARKLPPEPAVYKLFIQACGRCNLRNYAPKIMDMLARDRLATNPDIYTALIAAFSSDNSQPSAHVLHQMQGESSTSDISNSQHGLFDTKTNTPSEHSLSLSLSSASPGSSIKKSPRNLMSSFKNQKSKRRIKLSSKSLAKKQQAQATAAIAHQTELGSNLLESLYPGISIDHENVCPKCAHVLDEEMVVRGWTPCAANNYHTSCPTCQHKFVPKFAVSCNSPDFAGSQGNGSTLYCDYLSPWVILREIRSVITASGGIESILDEKFRSGTDIRATLWWNMIVTFERYELPHSFLLQGSNQLFLPPPSALTETIDENSV
eukprot:scaffold10823_cov126-Skeletonema_dohrnii-CCMP3373.AAC.2